MAALDGVLGAALRLLPCAIRSRDGGAGVAAQRIAGRQCRRLDRSNVRSEACGTVRRDHIVGGPRGRSVAASPTW